MVNLHQAQKQILNDNHRFRIVCCGRRFGKTTLAIIEIIARATLRENQRIVYIAPTYQQARDIAWQSLKKTIPIDSSAKPIYNEARLEIKINNGSLILLRGWEAIETLRGQAFDFMVIDEIAMMRNFWINWQEVIRPTLTDTVGQVLFISTPKGFNHFYDLYNLENEDKDFKSYHYSSYDNPFLPVEEIQKAKEELTEDRFAQEYMADFRKTEGLVYKSFNRQIHITDKEPNQIVKKITGIDWGWTNPASVYRVRIDGDRHYWIDSEFYKTQQTTEQIIQWAKMTGATEVYPDPAEPDRLEEARRAGLNVRDVSKDIVAGINKVQELFKQNRIHIHPDCKNLIWELETYHYPDKKPDKNEEEKPVKENDHACLVGDTKIIMQNGKSKKIRNIKVGDMVQTKNSLKQVIDSQMTRKNANIYEIILSNGLSLRGTGDHKIFTKNGKVSIDALRYGDIIEVLSSKQIPLWKKQSSLIIKDITGTVDIIAQLVGIKMEEKDYTKQYGNLQMEKYQKDFIYTTRTVIEETTPLIILNLLRLKNIYQNILKKTGKKKSLEKKLETISILLDHSLNYGTNLKKELNGIPNTVKKVGKIELVLKRFVKFAVKSIKLFSLTEVDFATKIVKLRRCGKEDVYNITVEGEHNYYANGINVANCDCIRYILYMQELEVPCMEELKTRY